MKEKSVLCSLALSFSILVTGCSKTHAAQRVYRDTIKISESDMALLCEGRKKCTIRLGNATVATPEIGMTDGRRTIRVRILRIDNQRQFKDISEKDAADEGSDSKEELIQDLKKYYPQARNTDPITVIYFERAEDC